MAADTDRLRSEPVITRTSFAGMTYLHSGKVRDMYDAGDHLLIVATDRLSAFDVIMNEGIPFKGTVLTKISEYWFGRMADIVENHFISSDPSVYPGSCKPHAASLAGRSMLVKKSKPLPVECVVRGYLSGSGWVDYQKTGAVCGVRLPAGLRESDKLPEPIFTPATKEQGGRHDENVDFETIAGMIGRDQAERVRSLATRIYTRAAEEARSKGIIIADTKMEFGTNETGEIILIDELLTPDSSRFWPADRYEPGRSQDSFDKQFVRDYLISISFNRQPPPPALPEEVILKTSALYLEAYERLTGRSLV